MVLSSCFLAQNLVILKLKHLQHISERWLSDSQALKKRKMLSHTALVENGFHFYAVVTRKKQVAQRSAATQMRPLNASTPYGKSKNTHVHTTIAKHYTYLECILFLQNPIDASRAYKKSKTRGP